jgi:hypothetical protein
VSASIRRLLAREAVADADIASLLGAVEATSYRSWRSARDCYLITGARILARNWTANRVTRVAP